MVSNGKKTFIELFAGIGLVRLGLEPQGWQCVYANDIDPAKKEVYSLNFDGEEFHLEDIWKTNPKHLPRNVDLLSASFPCIDLSLAGNRNGLNGNHSGTFWRLVELLEEWKRNNSHPRILLIENVTGFISSHKGQDFVGAVEALGNCGYYTDAFVLDARYFTPQSRPRLFMLALRPKIAKQVMNVRLGPNTDVDFFTLQRVLSTHNSSLRTPQIIKIIEQNQNLRWGFLDLPKPPSLKEELRHIVEKLPDSDERWWSEDRVEKLLSQMKPAHLETVLNYKKSNRKHFGTVYRRTRNGTAMAEIRFDGLAGCLRTPRGGSSKQILIQVGVGSVKARWMTPREYGRLQGVPDSFKLPDNDNQAYFGFGDAVCVPAVEWIAKKIINPVYSNFDN